VRADGVDRLTARGWDALVAHGVRTVIDLRNDEELRPDRAPRPGALETVRVPLDGIEDREFWDVWSAGPAFGTPLYYGPFLERFPERAASVVAAVARARPGGVVYHCSRGRDRTGLVTLLLLALLGADPAAVAADYELSASGVRALSADLGEPDQGPELEAFLAREGTSAAGVIAGLMASLDAEALLREGGLTAADLHAVQNRLLETGVTPL